jgi:hypothetical protein
MELLKSIPRIMDISDGDQFFSYHADSMYSINYIFNLPSQNKRGKTEQVLISIVFRFSSIADKALALRIINFLEKQKILLEKLVVAIKSNKEFSNGGLFAPALEGKVKQMLNLFYSSVFVEESRELLASESGEKIWVMGPEKYDIRGVLEKLRVNLQNLQRKSLKEEMMLFTITRLKFATYNCMQRYVGREVCQNCKQHYDEATAGLFLYDINDGKAIRELEDVINHINGIRPSVGKPFLILGINEIMEDATEKGLEIITDMFSVTDKMKFSSNFHCEFINLQDPDSYYNPLLWFIDACSNVSRKSAYKDNPQTGFVREEIYRRERRFEENVNA